MYINLQVDFKASRSVTGEAVALSTITELPIFYFSTFLKERLGHVRMIQLAGCAMILRLTCMMLFSVQPSLHLVARLLLYFAQCLHGFTFACYWSAVIDLISLYMPDKMLASCMALANLTYYTLSAITGNLIWGGLYDYVGATMIYFLATLVCATNCLVFHRWRDVFRKGGAPSRGRSSRRARAIRHDGGPTATTTAASSVIGGTKTNQGHSRNNGNRSGFKLPRDGSLLV